MGISGFLDEIGYDGLTTRARSYVHYWKSCTEAGGGHEVALLMDVSIVLLVAYAVVKYVQTYQASHLGIKFEKMDGPGMMSAMKRFGFSGIVLMLMLKQYYFSGGDDSECGGYPWPEAISLMLLIAVFAVSCVVIKILIMSGFVVAGLSKNRSMH